MMLALGRHLFESTLFAAIVALFIFCFRRRGAGSRHVMWLIAAAKFVMPVALFSFLGSKLAALFPSRSVSTAVHPVLSRWFMPHANSVPVPPHAGTANLLILIWLLGCAVAFLVWLPRLVLSRGSAESTESLQQDLLLRLKRRVGVRQEVSLRMSDSIGEPSLAGFRKPVVLIPSDLPPRLSSEELESVILHELAHAKRRDNWTSAFAHALTCLFWFYPLLWWIETRLRRECEVACDEMVVRCGASPDDYIAGILKVCRLRLNESVAGVSGVSGSNLKKRMEAIMSFSHERPLLRAPKALLGSLIAAVLLVPLLAGMLAASSAAGQPGKTYSHPATQAKAGSTATCVSASVQYPEGTVIQVGDGPEQMCVLNPNPVSLKSSGAWAIHETEWVTVNDTIRQRSATVIHLPQPPPFVCTPEPKTEKNTCYCQDKTGFSQGALVNSVLGPNELRCDNGKWAQTSFPNLKPK